MSSKLEKFNEITLLKQINHSLSDQIKNYNIMLDSINTILNKSYSGGNSYFMTWFYYYSVFTNSELDNRMNILKDYINDCKETMNANGRTILKLRGDKWNF